MKNLVAIFMAAALCFAAVSAEAKRMGSGRSMGQQSTNVTKQAAPAKKAPDAAPTASPGATAAAPARPWGAMLGGLAAGLGLAWLASSLGLGAAFGNILMALLIGFAVIAAIGWFMRKRMPNNNTRFAYQGPQPDTAVNQPTQFAGGSMIGSALTTTSTWTIPAGFDVMGFESQAKRNYIALQAAWDNADIVILQSMMTDELSADIRQQLTERGAEVNTTKVTSLDAVLLGIEEQTDVYLASVKFTGWAQEDADGVTEFAEVWNMTKSKTAGGWVIAGIQTV